MINKQLLSQLQSKFDFNAMIRVKAGRPLVNHLKNVIYMLGNHINLSLIKVIITFLFQINSMVKSNGISYTVKFLKANYVNLQQALGGSPLKDLNPLGQRFSRTNRGIPRIIPVQHRRRIRLGEVFIIRLWLSLFSLYRVFKTPYRLKQDTIIQPFSGTESVETFLKGYNRFLLKSFVPMVNRRYSTPYQKLFSVKPKQALNTFQVPSIFHIGKSTPTHGRVTSTSIQGQWSTQWQWSKSPLLPTLESFQQLVYQDRYGLQDSIQRWTSALNSLGYDSNSNRDPNNYNPRESLGRLGFKEEAAGKLRVFALVDCVTQWVMHPQHLQFFEILKLISQDGTFDQTGPLKRLIKSCKGKPLFSLDLSAATDRLPALVSRELLSHFCGKDLATLWYDQLVNRDFAYNYKGTKGTVRYAVGQPMGALSSWSFGLSFFHHSQIQYAHYLTLNDRDLIGSHHWFTDYALQGDDIVIANARVKDKYLMLLRLLGVECNISKSLISPSGSSLEFAKRFYHNGIDCSPISLWDELSVRYGFGSAISVAIMRKLSLSSFQTILGYGFRAKARLQVDPMNLPRRQGNWILGYHYETQGFSAFFSKLPDDFFRSLYDRYKSLQNKRSVKPIDNSIGNPYLVGWKMHFSSSKEIFEFSHNPYNQRLYPGSPKYNAYYCWIHFFYPIMHQFIDDFSRLGRFLVTEPVTQTAYSKLLCLRLMLREFKSLKPVRQYSERKLEDPLVSISPTEHILHYRYYRKWMARKGIRRMGIRIRSPKPL